MPIVRYECHFDLYYMILPVTWSISYMHPWPTIIVYCFQQFHSPTQRLGVKYSWIWNCTLDQFSQEWNMNEILLFYWCKTLPWYHFELKYWFFTLDNLKQWKCFQLLARSTILERKKVLEHFVLNNDKLSPQSISPVQSCELPIQYLQQLAKVSQHWLNGEREGKPWSWWWWGLLYLKKVQISNTNRSRKLFAFYFHKWVLLWWEKNKKQIGLTAENRGNVGIMRLPHPQHIYIHL